MVMTAQEITLNISVNLNRLVRFALEKRNNRITFFLAETKEYLSLLEKSIVSSVFQKTLDRFSSEFQTLSTAKMYDEQWAEEMATWSNILQHRAKLLA
jgi:hypothetical protein